MPKEVQTIDEETGLPVIIPGQKPPSVETPKNISEARERTRSRLKDRKQAPQPLATRHLDPRYNPAMEADGVNYTNKIRVKLRAGYTFYVGEKLAYKGPAILYLTPEQIEKQEHKIEILGDKPVKMLASEPVAVKEDMSALDRAKKIEALKAELETLEAEHVEYIKETTEKVDAATDTVIEPEHNEAAEAPETKPPPPPSPPPAPGSISGPAVEGTGAGRPAGKVSRLKKG